MRIRFTSFALLAGVAACGGTPPAPTAAPASAAPPATASAPAKPAVPSQPQLVPKPQSPAVAQAPADVPATPPKSRPESAATPKSAPAPKTAAPKAAAPQPVAPGEAKPAAPAPAAVAAAPALDLKSLEQRLKDTNAIGLMTKLSLKNQVDDLVTQFRAYHDGRRPPTLPELRRPYELLLMKILSLLQDRDPGLASSLHDSRETIWGVLSDRDKFSRLT